MNDEYIPTLPQDSGEAGSAIGSEDDQGLFQVGQRLLDQYEIFGVNKKGKFGVVYFVTDSETDQEYAVKTYKPEYANLLSSVDKFKDEVAFWVNLDPHPNIVKAHFVEVIEDQPYLFLEYIKDGTLRDRLSYLKRLNKEKGLNEIGLQTDEAIDFAYQLCLGMEFANHDRAKEIAHCDLKPENILINNEGVLKISDFGLAEWVAVHKGKYAKVEYGSGPYAAPEYFLGHQAANTQTDIYAFGIILYEMLTGKFPYPFELSEDEEEKYDQLANFHSTNGMHDLSRELYYRGVAGVNGAGQVISGCIEHHTGSRFRDFKMLRERIEYLFEISPSRYKNVEVSTRQDPHQLALSLHRVGRYSEALSIFNRLLIQQNDNGQLYLDAAKTLLAINQKDTARKFLKHALHMDSTLVEAKHLLGD